MSSWIRARRRNTNVIVDLPWKTHRPVVLTEKLEHYCTGCESTRNGGMRLWWKSLADTNSWLCHACYTKADWVEIVPRGFEGAESQRELEVRLKEFITQNKLHRER
jgi:hypothetical protein